MSLCVAAVFSWISPEAIVSTMQRIRFQQTMSPQLQTFTWSKDILRISLFPERIGSSSNTAAKSGAVATTELERYKASFFNNTISPTIARWSDTVFEGPHSLPVGCNDSCAHLLPCHFPLGKYIAWNDFVITCVSFFIHEDFFNLFTQRKKNRSTHCVPQSSYVSRTDWCLLESFDRRKVDARKSDSEAMPHNICVSGLVSEPLPDKLAERPLFLTLPSAPCSKAINFIILQPMTGFWTEANGRVRGELIGFWFYALLRSVAEMVFKLWVSRDQVVLNRGHQSSASPVRHTYTLNHIGDNNQWPLKMWYSTGRSFCGTHNFVLCFFMSPQKCHFFNSRFRSRAESLVVFRKIIMTMMINFTGM